MGGPGGTLISAAEEDRLISFENLHLNTGGSFIIFDETRDMLDVAVNFTHFFAHESCGFCTPCRVGTKLMMALTDKVAEGHGARLDIEQMRRLHRLMTQASHCGLGIQAAEPILSTYEKFPESFHRRMDDMDFKPAFDVEGAIERSRQIVARGGVCSMTRFIEIDGAEVPFADGQTIMQAASDAGVFIPHLCYHPDYAANGSCKMCTCKVNGKLASSCTTRADEGQVIESNTEELNSQRRALTQMLFAEGNHHCPSCEASGNCVLQSMAYRIGMTAPLFTNFHTGRATDASHPEMSAQSRSLHLLRALCTGLARQ